MSKQPQFHFDPAANGVFRAPQSYDDLRGLAESQEIEWCSLDLTGVMTKRVFLKRCAVALQFPAGFGGNWDALADCLEDLSWQAAGGVVVHWQNGGAFAKSLPKDFSTALAIFTDAATYWSEQARVMLVMLDENSLNGRLLPPLPSA